MPKTKKKFIDRKNAVTFHLVHRSQQDPLAADETAPQHVLLEAREKRSKEDKSRREIQQKYGVYYDDDYNYLQHLRDANTITVDWEPVERHGDPKSESLPSKLPAPEKPKGKPNLPSSVFASEIEEDVGLLNKAAPQTGLRLDLDPEVVAAMDEDFDFDDPDNQLEDNFMELANGDSDSEYEDCSSDECNASDGEADDEVGSLGERQFDEEETKSRFTEYSMTSSVMRRNEQLSILDGRFEHMFAGYDDSEIGALECEEIEGHVAPDDLFVLQCAEEFKRQRATEKLTVEASRRYVASESSGEDDFQDLEIPDRHEEKWDCQSILSTYSNIYNRPKLISEPKGPSKIRVDRKTGIPLGVIDGRDGKLTTGALARHDAANRHDDDSDGDDEDDRTVMSKLSTLSIRPPGETPDQRSERKKALKEYRKERRLERKANTLAFKEEKKRQEKILLNNTKNQQTVHIV